MFTARSGFWLSVSVSVALAAFSASAHAKGGGGHSPGGGSQAPTASAKGSGGTLDPHTHIHPSAIGRSAKTKGKTQQPNPLDSGVHFKFDLKANKAQ